MESRGGRFRRADRLRKPGEFRRVSAEGQRHSGSNFVVLQAISKGASVGVGSRLGVTVSRKVGGAVQRNQVKRRLREWFRRSRNALPPGSDWVVIARPRARALGYAALVTELDRLSGIAGGSGV